jgi:succinoglycan biosynthesis protein ExoL
MNQIIFISSALQQPRHQKRIDILSKEYKVNVFYFFRNKYLNNYKHYINDAKKIGDVEDGKYYSRIFLLIKLYFMLLKSNIKLVYCTSPDQVLFALMAGKRVYFEVGDLYQIDGKNKIFQYLDNIIIPRIQGLILTSPFFYSGYYKKFENYLLNKVVIVENRLVPELDEKISHYREGFEVKVNRKKVKIAVIGSLLFEKSLKLIRDFVSNNADVELHVYGDGLIDIFKDIPNFFYHGRFKSPEDLAEIYNNIDINIILYDYDNNNVKLALPNKLYESIAYLKPIVCASNVALSDYVVSNNIGVVVQEGKLREAIDQVLSNYDQLVLNLRNMPKQTYLCYEQEDILKLLSVD